MIVLPQSRSRFWFIHVRTTCCIAGEGGIENDETTPMNFPNVAGKTAAAATKLLVVMATNDDFIVW